MARRSSTRIFQAQAGFTLVESLVSLSVAAILAALGAPSLSDLASRQAVKAEADEFRQVLRRTRTEAVRRATQVTVCALDPSSTADAPACVPTGQNWSAGWVLFVDRGDRGEIEEGDQVLAVHQASERIGSISGTLRYVTFQSLGISSSAASNFKFRPEGADPLESNPDGSLLVCVNKPGRTRVLKASACS
ncbi:GspH/FimT family pseudopilin [Ideonella sp.]|uniref:GspH/FimT family pseudopilin n=1 Tax=Ideonella sp. TaxID=1929293 RepID=UPI003BB58115